MVSDYSPFDYSLPFDHSRFSIYLSSLDGDDFRYRLAHRIRLNISSHQQRDIKQSKSVFIVLGSGLSKEIRTK
jgi:hypothetical protein